MAETELKRKRVFMITLIIQLCWSCLGQLSHFLSSSKQRPARVENTGITLELDCKEVTVVKQNAAVILIIVICPNVSSISFTKEGPPLRLVLGWARAVMSITADLADKVDTAAVMLSCPGLTLIRAIKLT